MNQTANLKVKIFLLPFLVLLLFFGFAAEGRAANGIMGRSFMLGVSYFDGMSADSGDLNADLVKLKNEGFEAIRVWATWVHFTGSQFVDVFDANGGINDAGLANLKRIITAAKNNGIIVDVTFCYCDETPLRTDNAYIDGVIATDDALKNYNNIFFDINNEGNHANVRSGNNSVPNLTAIQLKKIRDGIETVNPTLPVTVSWDEDAADAYRAVNTDFITTHAPSRTGDSQWANETDDTFNAISADAGPGAAVLFDEPNRCGGGPPSFPRAGKMECQNLSEANIFIDAAKNAKSAGAAGWFLHNWASYDLRGQSMFDNFNNVEEKIIEDAEEELNNVQWGGNEEDEEEPPPDESGGGDNFCGAGWRTLGDSLTPGSAGPCEVGPSREDCVNMPTMDERQRCMSRQVGELEFRCGEQALECWIFPFGVGDSKISGIERECNGSQYATTTLDGGESQSLGDVPGTIGVRGPANKARATLCEKCPDDDPDCGTTEEPALTYKVCKQNTCPVQLEAPAEGEATCDDIPENAPCEAQQAHNYCDSTGQCRVGFSNEAQESDCNACLSSVSDDCKALDTDTNNEWSADECAAEGAKDQCPTLCSGYGTDSPQIGPGSGPDFTESPPLPALPPAANIGQLISRLFTWSLSIVGAAVFLMIFFAGVLRITAAGNPQKIKQSTEYIKNAISGAILLFSAYIILNTINPDLVKQEGTLFPGLQNPDGTTTTTTTTLSGLGKT